MNRERDRAVAEAMGWKPKKLCTEGDDSECVEGTDHEYNCGHLYSFDGNRSTGNTTASCKYFRLQDVPAYSTDPGACAEMERWAEGKGIMFDVQQEPYGVVVTADRGWSGKLWTAHAVCSPNLDRIAATCEAKCRAFLEAAKGSAK